MDGTLTDIAQELQTKLQDPGTVIVAHLCKNAIHDTVGAVVLGDLVECDFDGYAPVELEDWTDVPTVDDRLAEAVSENATFTAGTNITPQLITGEYVTSQTGSDPARIIFFRPLPTPFLMDKPELSWELFVRMQYAHVA